MDKKILFLATVDSHIYYFHIPFMKLLRDMGYKVEVAAASTGFKEKIENEGFKVYKLSFNRNPLSLLNLKAFFKILNLMNREKYFMLHTHTPVASFLGRIAGRIAGIPNIIYTVHGFHFHEHGNKFKNFIYYRLERFAGRFTDVLITINSDDYSFAVRKKMILNGRIEYIKGIGVDTNKFQLERVSPQKNNDLRCEFNIDDGDFVIVSIAELIKRKNISDAIEAFSILAAKYENVKLLIVGDGILMKTLKELVEKKHLSDRVIFTGRRQDISEILSISNIFVLSSLQEGLPKSIMEAMSMKKPVIAYDIRGVRDLVVNFENGFLVPFRDIKAFADKCSYLIENPDMLLTMGENSRKRISQYFSLSVIIEEMKNLYMEILERQV
jgi:glycosyltransferase involved in cell wall biosynthesis